MLGFATPQGHSLINTLISVRKFRIKILLFRKAKHSFCGPFVNKPATMSVRDDTGVIN